MKAVIKEIREALKNNINDNSVQQKYFKEEIKEYGVQIALVSQIAKDTFKEIKNSPKSDIFNLCETLWKSGYLEEAYIVCNWSYALREKYAANNIETFESWVANYVSNWVTCDTLCNRTIGNFLEMYPEQVGVLKKWAISENRWMRRAAAVSLITPARKGMFLDHVVEIADLLLLDKDDLVQKGYGWMLKDASKVYPNKIFDFVIKHKATMPRTALRYAIEKLPQDMRIEAMRK